MANDDLLRLKGDMLCLASACPVSITARPFFHTRAARAQHLRWKGGDRTLAGEREREREGEREGDRPRLGLGLGVPSVLHTDELR